MSIPPDIRAAIAKLDQLIAGTGTPKEIKERNEKVCRQALQILRTIPDPTNQGQVFAALQSSLEHVKLTQEQHKRLYSALAKTSLSYAQTHKLDERKVNYEEFSDFYTLQLKDGTLKISKAELSTLAEYFNGLFRSGGLEVESKTIQLTDVTKEQFAIFREYMESDICPYDLYDPGTWVTIKTIAGRFNVQDLGVVFPPYPRFESVDAAIEFVVEHRFSELDLSQFRDKITDSDLDKIHVLSQGDNAPLSHLTKLVIRSKNISTLKIAAGGSKLPRGLTSLDLSGCERLKHEEFYSLPEGLTAFRLIGPPHITDEGLAHLPRSLTSLELGGQELITDAGLSELPRGLKSLLLTKNKKITDAGISKLPEGLTELWLSNINIKDAGLSKLPKGLKSLFLMECSMITNAGLSSLPEGLTSLELITCPITDVGHSKLPRGLKSLKLCQCDITGAGLTNLPEELTSLELISVRLIDADISKLPRGLKSLVLSNCDISDEALSELPEGLISLSLEGCSGLTGKGFSKLPKGLKSLDLTNWAQLTDEMLSELPRGLKSLILWRSPKLTDAGLLNLPEGLRFLDIRLCKQVTAGGLSKLNAEVKVS